MKLNLVSMEGRDLKKGRVVSLHKGGKLSGPGMFGARTIDYIGGRVCVFKTGGFSAWSHRWRLDCK